MKSSESLGRWSTSTPTVTNCVWASATRSTCKCRMPTLLTTGTIVSSLIKLPERFWFWFFPSPYVNYRFYYISMYKEILVGFLITTLCRNFCKKVSPTGRPCDDESLKQRLEKDETLLRWELWFGYVTFRLRNSCLAKNMFFGSRHPNSTSRFFSHGLWLKS